MAKLAYWNDHVAYFHFGGLATLTPEERAYLDAPYGAHGDRSVDAYQREWDRREELHAAAAVRARATMTLADRWRHAAMVRNRLRKHGARSGWRLNGPRGYDPAYRHENDRLRERKHAIERNTRHWAGIGPFEDWEHAGANYLPLYYVNFQRIGVGGYPVDDGEWATVCGACVGEYANDLEAIVAAVEWVGSTVEATEDEDLACERCGAVLDSFEEEPDERQVERDLYADSFRDTR